MGEELAALVFQFLLPGSNVLSLAILLNILFIKNKSDFPVSSIYPISIYLSISKV
jgi:hypothetical protein